MERIVLGEGLPVAKQQIKHSPYVYDFELSGLALEVERYNSKNTDRPQTLVSYYSSKQRGSRNWNLKSHKKEN